MYVIFGGSHLLIKSYSCPCIAILREDSHSLWIHSYIISGHSVCFCMSSTAVAFTVLEY